VKLKIETTLISTLIKLKSGTSFIILWEQETNFKY